MTLQERELELKYLRIIHKRLCEEGDAMYAHTPAKTAECYTWDTSRSGGYSYEVECKLKDLAMEWRKTDEAKAYEDIVMRAGHILSVISKLEKAQTDYVIEKYNLEV